MSTLIFLGMAGLVPALLTRTRPLILGASTMALLPVAALLEMAVDPTSHNLWPIEFVFYAVAALPGFAGALAGRRLRPPLPEESREP